MTPLEQLKSAGYVLIENAISKSENDLYRDTLYKFWETEESVNPEFSRRPPQSIINNLSVRTRVFDPLLTHKGVTSLCAEMLGKDFHLGEIRACNVDKSDRIAFIHQDGYIPSLPEHPLSLVAIWCIEDFSVETGATVVFPGSHHWPFKPNEENVKLFSYKQVEAPAGSVFVFNSNLWHGPAANTSGRSRWSLNVCYFPWFIKPFFSMPPRFNEAEFQSLSDELKVLFGFTTRPPIDETKQVRTVIKASEATLIQK